MIVHPVMIIRNNCIGILDDLTFPDGMNTSQYARYIQEEWIMPAGMLEGLNIPDDVKIRCVVSAVNQEENFAYLFLIPTKQTITMGPPCPEMTQEQIEVLTLIQKGLKIRQIARRLDRSVRWVQYRVAEIKQKQGVVTRGAKSRLELSLRVDQNTYARRERPAH